MPDIKTHYILKGVRVSKESMRKNSPNFLEVRDIGQNI
jgi:hypothetical protein